VPYKLYSMGNKGQVTNINIEYNSLNLSLDLRIIIFTETKSLGRKLKAIIAHLV
jgi:hypothetical protein